MRVGGEEVRVGGGRRGGWEEGEVGRREGEEGRGRVGGGEDEEKGRVGRGRGKRGGEDNKRGIHSLLIISMCACLYLYWIS